MFSNAGRRWWIGRWLVAMMMAACGCGLVADFLIAERCAERSSELVLKTVAARIAAGIRDEDGRPRPAGTVAQVRVQRRPADAIRYAVRTNRGDLVAGDAMLVTGPIARTSLVDAEPGARAFTEVFHQDARTFVVTVAESDARHAAVFWSLFRQLLLPTWLLTATFALIAWLVVRMELRSA